jgi:hypothetical protein
MSLGIAVRERQTTASKTLGCLIVKLRLEGEGRVIFEATDNLPFFPYNFRNVSDRSRLT